MSKRADGKLSLEEEKSSDEDESFKYRMHLTSVYPDSDQHELYQEEAGPSHLETSTFGSTEVHHAATLRTRGPGRPRIHPLKPSGVSRPRGRPRGSKNKKPRKRLEKPPKRPRGRPRIWPPEMWEGFQRTRQAVVQQRLQRQHIQLQQEHASSPMFIQPTDVPSTTIHAMPTQSHFLPMQHTRQPLHHSLSQQHVQPQEYMQMPLETDQLHTLPLSMPPRGHENSMPVQPLVSSVMMRGSEHQLQERLQASEELLWMHHIPHEDPHPSTTSR